MPRFAGVPVDQERGAPIAAPLQGPPLLRPFKPGETRPNADGSYSTEISTTWQDPDGQWVNIPSLWMGPNGPQQFEDGDEDGIMTARKNFEQINGPTFKRFPSLGEAEAAARARSAAGGAGANAAVAPSGKPRFAGVPVEDAAPSDAPWYAKAGQAADDMARIIANGATFGYADKLAGVLGGSGTDLEREKTNAARDRAGSAAIAGDVIGALGTMKPAADAGLTLARFIPQSSGLATRLLTGTGLMAAEGAGYGALQATGYDEDPVQGAKYGAAAGALGNLAGEALTGVANKVIGSATKQPVMTPDELVTAKRESYKTVDNLGAAYTPEAFSDLVSNMTNEVKTANISPMRHPKASSMMTEIQELAKEGHAPSLTQLDQLRQVIRRDVANASDPAEAFFGRKMIGALDSFIGSSDAGNMAVGNAGDAAAAIGRARDLNTRVRKTDDVLEAVDRAKLRAGSTGSGGNVDNATRQELRRVLQYSHGLTPDEEDALRTAIMGTPGQNALRLVGKLSPQGNGLMAALGVGGAMTNPVLGVPALVGLGAKQLADRSTAANVQDVLEAIARGGTRDAGASLREGIKDDLMRALFATGLSGGNAQAQQ